MKRYILILIFSLSFHISTAQQPTPTPVGIISMQGRDNTGQVQLLSIDEVIQQTGVLSWKESNWTGRNQRVGVLDQGFGQLAEFESMNGISVNIAPGGNRATYTDTVITHGTNVLSVIHAIAPDAELYACEYLTLDVYVSCIDWMIASDVNIVNHSAGVPALPLDGTSRWAREVDRAARSGILWVNAAGNFAEGYFTDRFTDTQPNKLHEFRAVGPENNEALGVRITEQTSRSVVMLSWSNYGDQQATDIDLDLQILDAETGEVITGSYEEQAGFPTDQAMEYVSFSPERPYAVQVIDNTSEASGVEFVLFVAFAQLPTVRSQGSVIAPGDSPNSLTVGALQGIRLAPYSSRGQLENGQFGVELVAPGEVRLRDGTDFIGTSAAAAVVSGSAALIWQANPEFDADDVRTYLENATFDDTEFPGPDNNYGYGSLYMPVPPKNEITTPENITGQFLRIGILDQGFGRLLELESNTDIFLSIPSNQTRTSYNVSEITHGTNALSITHAISPNTEFFACEYITLNDYIECIDWMIISEVDIINHSAGVPMFSFNNASYWINEVRRVTNTGIIWINLAEDYSSSYIQEYFKDEDYDTYHEFNSNEMLESLTINPKFQQNGHIILSWEGSNTLAPNEIDFDLEVVNDSGQIIVSSTNSQSGNSDELALEVLQVDMSNPFYIRIRNSDGHGIETQFNIFIENFNFNKSINPEFITLLENENNVLIVKSLYNIKNEKDSYIAIDGQIDSLDNYSTASDSAATSILAGVAALVWEANPDWTQSQMYQYLKEITD